MWIGYRDWRIGNGEFCCFKKYMGSWRACLGLGVGWCGCILCVIVEYRAGQLEGKVKKKVFGWKVRNKVNPQCNLFKNRLSCPPVQGEVAVKNFVLTEI